MFPKHVYKTTLTACYDDKDSFDQNDNIISRQQIIDSILHDFSVLVLVKDLHQVQPPILLVTNLEISYRKMHIYSIP
jgi:hypothetical protein